MPDIWDQFEYNEGNKHVSKRKFFKVNDVVFHEGRDY